MDLSGKLKTLKVWGVFFFKFIHYRIQKKNRFFFAQCSQWQKRSSVSESASRISFLSEREEKNNTQQDTCQKSNPLLSKPLTFCPKTPKTQLNYTGEDVNRRLFGLEKKTKTPKQTKNPASLRDWVRRWVLTPKSPRRLFYLSKARFHLFGTKAACSICEGRTCHSAHVSPTWQLKGWR